MNSRAFKRAREKADKLLENPCSEVVVEETGRMSMSIPKEFLMSVDLAVVEHRAMAAGVLSWRSKLAEELCVMPSSLSQEEIQEYKHSYYCSGFGMRVEKHRED